MRATVYYDASDRSIDEVIAHEHFDRELKRMGFVAEVTMKADARIVGRRPLLVLDGGLLGR